MRIMTHRLAFLRHRNDALQSSLLLLATLLFLAPHSWSSNLPSSSGSTRIPVFNLMVNTVSNGIAIHWETGDGDSTIGFNIYRAGQDQSFTKMNTSFLPGPADYAPAGADFLWIDSTVTPGEVYRYQLEPIAPQGPYPPIESDPIQATDSLTTLRNASTYTIQIHTYTQRRRLPAPSPPTRSLQRGSPNSQIKMTVRDRGIYHVSSDGIGYAFGLTTNDVIELISKRLLSLSSQGSQISWAPAENNNGILFYNESFETLYTQDNVFWLRKGRGHVFPTNSGTSAVAYTPGLSFKNTEHCEENHRSVLHLLYDPDHPYWYWYRFYSSLSSSSMPFRVESLCETSSVSHVTMKFLSSSTVGLSNEHHVVVSINGSHVADGIWEGLTDYTLSGDFPSSILSNGWNSLTLSGVLESNIPYSLIYWDWFEIEYEKYYSTSSNLLYCSAKSAGTVTASGFSSDNLLAWDVSDVTNAHPITPLSILETNGSFAVSFDATANGKYYLCSRELIAEVTNLQSVNTQYDLLSPTNATDYLVITREDFSDALSPLIALRRSQGLTCKTVYIDDLFNRFSRGISTPIALHDFLSYCHEKWIQPPSYILLAGQGSYDYKNYMGGSENIIPAKMVYTPYAITCSDNWMVDDNLDGMPAAPIGRLPATTAGDLSNMVTKIINYETASWPTVWSNNFLLLTDNPDDGGNFPDSGDQATAGLPTYMTKQKIDLTTTDITSARNQLMTSLNEGVLFFNYFGHGAYNRLASEGVLKNADIASITNESAMAVTLGMTCFINYFAHPDAVFIGEHMVLQPNGGMVASWAPSGNSLNALATILDSRFLHYYANTSDRRIGKLINAAIKDYLDGGNSSFETYQYILLGDPALRIK